MRESYCAEEQHDGQRERVADLESVFHLVLRLWTICSFLRCFAQRLYVLLSSDPRLSQLPEVMNGKERAARVSRCEPVHNQDSATLVGEAVRPGGARVRVRQKRHNRLPSQRSTGS
jgi:hypothetical protein